MSATGHNPHYYSSSANASFLEAEEVEDVFVGVISATTQAWMIAFVRNYLYHKLHAAAAAVCLVTVHVYLAYIGDTYINVHQN